MKLVTYLVIFFGCMLATITLAMHMGAAEAAGYPPPVYVPIAGYYDESGLVDVRAFPERRYPTLEICKENLARLELHSQAPGSALRAVCFPFPMTAK